MPMISSAIRPLAGTFRSARWRERSASIHASIETSRQMLVRDGGLIDQPALSAILQHVVRSLQRVEVDRSEPIPQREQVVADG